MTPKEGFLLRFDESPRGELSSREITLHGFLLDERVAFAKRENRSERRVFRATAKPRRGFPFYSGMDKP